MKKIFINSAVSISAQNTFNSSGFPDQIIPISEATISAQHPNYKDFITPTAARRMASGIKMGVTAANQALQLAAVKEPDAIITGTGIGCIEDTEKFLNAIISNDEAFLTPTSFIQSTHNTVGAQIALSLQCKAYNNTFTHATISFESALMDAQLLLETEEAKNVLTGSLDELGNEIIYYIRMMEDKTPGGIKVPFGEGASFFVISDEPQQNAIELIDVEVISAGSEKEITETLAAFLKRHNLSVSDIDALIFGRNGDTFDHYYDTVHKMIPSTQLHYKHVIGEFYTASAFGLWTGVNLLKQQNTPSDLLYNGTLPKVINCVLLYNQFKGRDHSFILLKR